MKKLEKKVITICSSASFYTQVLETEAVLKKAGFAVSVPLTANKMKKSGDFRVETYKTWFKNPKDYKRKTFLTRHHFNKIERGNTVLVLNYEKKGIKGYIGGAVLGEMAIALHFKKKIYVLNPIDESCSYKEEILAMNPTILNGDLSRIR
ncbi:MAG: hypothetical protein WCW36_03065 [Candidatus Paceibacterota bacterium]|jgi:hypothetical protein